MTFEFDITYLSCQSCAAKVNCSTCNANAETSLLRDPEISAASVLIDKKTASVESTLDRLDVEDLLEDLGIFV